MRPTFPFPLSTRNSEEPIFLYTLGVDKLKNQVIGRLQIETDGTGPAPGYCHFPIGRDASYYEQLTAERLVTTLRANRRVTEWQKDSSSARNEALDCRVYAYAAFLIRAPKLSVLALKQKRKLAALSAARGDVPAAETGGAVDDEPAPPAQDAAPHPVQDARRHARRTARRTVRSRVASLRAW
jgi:phage terminase large subunit GpA-like protein